MTQPVLPESETDDAAAPALPVKSRRRARFLLPLGLFLLVALALVFALRPKPVPPPVVPVYTPQQAATAQQHIAALSAQLLHPSPVSSAAPVPAAVPSPAAPRTDRPAPPQASPRSAAVRLQLSEADINTLLATNPQVVHALRAHGVNAIQILLHPPQGIDIRAAVFYKGHPANMEVIGTLQASPQTIVRFVASHAQIGRVPLPASVVTKQAANLAERYTPRVRGRLPLQVQGVQIIQSNLVLTGVPLAKTAR